MQVTKSNSPNFGKFIKVKGDKLKVQQFREALRAKNDKFVTLCVKDKKDKSSLYLFSGKHFDKFVDITKKVHFFEFRTNFEKYMGKVQKTFSVNKAFKEFINK